MPYITSAHEVQIPADTTSPKVITNLGPNTLYYKSTSGVTTADTALASGSDLEITSVKYVIAAAGDTRIDISDVPEAQAETTISGPPVSGTSGTGAGLIGKGGTITDTDNGAVFINEGTLSSPYWTPVSLDQPALFGVYEDFRGVSTGKALADTAAAATFPSGLRVFGQGMTENGDSGLVGGVGVEGQAHVGVLHVTNEAAHLSAVGTDAGIYQPDQHKLLVVDVEFTDNADILTSALFCGFVGTAADALDPPVTGATTVATFVQDDVAGLYSDAGMTDVDGVFAVSEKSNTAGTQTGLTALTTRAAAGTYQRWRVEVNATGSARVFVNKVDLGLIPGTTAEATHSASEDALDANEEVSPVFAVINSTATTRTATLKRFATWAYR